MHGYTDGLEWYLKGFTESTKGMIMTDRQTDRKAERQKHRKAKIPKERERERPKERLSE